MIVSWLASCIHYYPRPSQYRPIFPELTYWPRPQAEVTMAREIWQLILTRSRVAYLRHPCWMTLLARRVCFPFCSDLDLVHHVHWQFQLKNKYALRPPEVVQFLTVYLEVQRFRIKWFVVQICAISTLFSFRLDIFFLLKVRTLKNFLVHFIVIERKFQDKGLEAPCCEKQFTVKS